MELLVEQPTLVVSLAILGLGVGFLTGMFGVGGAFIAGPVMIAFFGLPESEAVGVCMGFTLVNGSLALFRHSGAGNFEPKAMWPIALASCVGTITGYQFHKQLAEAAGENFGSVINGLFCTILIPIGCVVWWQSSKGAGKPLLSRLKVPPMASLRQENLPPVSLTLLALIGLTIGCTKGVLGIGGGIILVPFLVLIVGLTPHRAVATSLGMVVMSSLVGTCLYAADDHVNFFLVAAIMIGSLGGVVLGAKFCNVTSPKRLKRMLAALILVFAALLGAKELWQLFG